MVDYYEILEVPRGATDPEIRKSYQRLALKWHPERNKDQLEVAEEKFDAIGEAYDVLRDKKRRAVFDLRGIHGLVVDGGYKFEKGKAQIVFKEYFGTDSPYHPSLGDTEFWKLDGYVPPKKIVEKASDLNVSLPCTLEELYLGTLKKMTVTRQILDEEVKNVFPVKVQAGWRNGTKAIFGGKGNQLPDTLVGDLVFVIEEVKHEKFARQGSDLVFSTCVNLEKALTGSTITVNTLDGRNLQVPVSEVVRPGFRKIIKGEGMPKNSRRKEFGDLIIEFDVEFPKALSEEQKEFIRKALNPKKSVPKPIKKEEKRDEE